MEKNQSKLLLSKLRQPIHINYIAKYILKESIDETRKKLTILIEDGILIESKTSKDYYTLKIN